MCSRRATRPRATQRDGPSAWPSSASTWPGRSPAAPTARLPNRGGNTTTTTLPRGRRPGRPYQAAPDRRLARLAFGAGAATAVSAVRASLTVMPDQHPHDGQPDARYEDLIADLIGEPGVTPPQGGGFGRS